MDRLKDMASNAGGIGDMLKGINFPVNKDDLVSQLSQKGAPSQVTDQLKNANTDQFTSQNDVMDKVKGMM